MKAIKWIIGIIILMITISCFKDKQLPSPNIIFILTDDLGFQDLSSYGSIITNTPNLDKLASEGALLNSYYSAQAVC
ncbi:MAG: sulfatase-like hydrolase/transferase, partial [Flavobacteriaceae bacterium]|nr:sulfatase-like hydrolase/transferase [Flavobacteriaceae bacterium]